MMMQMTFFAFSTDFWAICQISLGEVGSNSKKKSEINHPLCICVHIYINIYQILEGLLYFTLLSLCLPTLILQFLVVDVPVLILILIWLQPEEAGMYMC